MDNLQLESGIISLADIVESASRSLTKPTPSKIQKMVHDLVMDRVTSGQMDNSGLTLGEIKTISESFSSTLNSMMHTRVDYPEDDDKAKKQKDTYSEKNESSGTLPEASSEGKGSA